MRHRYSWLDPDLIRQLLEGMGLRRLFNQLLLQTGGDVEEAMRWMRMMQNRGYIDPNIDLEAFFAQLTEENIIGEDAQGNVVLAAGGERQIRRDALDEIFGGLQKSISGYHSVATAGQGTERLTETRQYQFGDDPMSLDSIRTLQNAMKHNDPSDAITITEEDLEVFETEHNSSCATVVMIDISHSMILYGEDRITPAKKIALALSQLIQTRYPRDTLDVVLFGDEAVRVPLRDLLKIQAGPHHTNTKAGLQLAQRVLASRKGVNKQIFMITDGKPSAIHEHGRLYKNPFGLDPKIVNRTLEEAAYCRRKGVTITTFMLATDYPLLDFVRKLTALNHGRIYETDPNNIGAYVFRDFVRNRRKRLH
jgi:uncharacterized protein with von Willebrand factor type A (vWA) domain